jgi:hypothetical protein
MSFAGLLDKTVTIRRGTSTTSATRITTKAFANVSTNVPASVQRVRGGLSQRDVGLAVLTGWSAFFEPDADVQEGDHVVDGAATYLVLSIENVREHHLEVELQRLGIP